MGPGKRVHEAGPDKRVPEAGPGRRLPRYHSSQSRYLPWPGEKETSTVAQIFLAAIATEINPSGTPSADGCFFLKSVIDQLLLLESLFGTDLRAEFVRMERELNSRVGLPERSPEFDDGEPRQPKRQRRG